MNQIAGARSVEYSTDSPGTICGKYIDDRNGDITKAKFKERYDDKC